MFDSMKRLPKITWVLVLAAFILGMLLRGGGASLSDEGGEHTHEATQASVWTCSMHPNIQLQEFGQCPICFMDLIPLESDGGGESAVELKMSEAAMALAEIVTAPVVFGPAEGLVRLSGKVALDETRTGKIAAWTGGRLEKLYVDFTGTVVKMGDPLVEVYSPAIYAAQEELLQAIKSLEGAQSEFQKRSAQMITEASREKLRQLGMTQTQVEKIEKRGKATDRIIILSPLSGVVIHKNAVEGMYVKEGAPIYTIADLSRVWVTLDVYETELGRLHVGQFARFTVEAFPGEMFEGKVVFVDPILNEKTRTVRARLNVENADGRLKPGLFVRAEVAVGSDTSVLQVPVTAVMKTGKRAIVYIRKPDTDTPVFEMREIVVGQRYGDVYAVISGLDSGEKVVVHGNFKIDSAMQIAGKFSMMNPEGGGSGGAHAHHGDGAGSVSAETSAETLEPYALDRMEVTVDFLSVLAPVYADYFTAQSALADDDFEIAKKAIADLDQRMKAIPMNLVATDAMPVWHAIDDKIHEAVEHVLHWSDIEEARKAFEAISYAILKMEHAFGHVGDTPHFEVFCTMAFNDKGAPWLQNHNTVDNPYFGDQMLRCGEVKVIFGFDEVLPIQIIDDVPAKFVKELKSVYKSYFDAQKNLADDNFKAGQKALKKLNKVVGKVKVKDLDETAIKQWSSLAKAMLSETEHAEHYSDISEARIAFKAISLAVLKLVKTFGHSDDVDYYQIYCSMAFDDTGACWLQNHEETHNSYWGAEMPRCGEVREVFEPRD